MRVSATSRTAVVRTRMPGGVGGAEPRGSPLSRSLPQAADPPQVTVQSLSEAQRTRRIGRVDPTLFDPKRICTGGRPQRNSSLRPHPGVLSLRLEWETRRKSIDYLREWLQMLLRCLFFCGLTLAVTTTLGSAQSQSPNGVKTLNPPGAISTGSDTWSVGARAGGLHLCCRDAGRRSGQQKIGGR